MLLLVGFAVPSTPSWKGQLKWVGSEPFITLVLEDEQGHQWMLRGEHLGDLLEEGDGRFVRVAGDANGRVITVTAWEPLAEDAAP